MTPKEKKESTLNDLREEINSLIKLNVHSSNEDAYKLLVPLYNDDRADLSESRKEQLKEVRDMLTIMLKSFLSCRSVIASLCSLLYIYKETSTYEGIVGIDVWEGDDKERFFDEALSILEKIKTDA